MNQLTDRLAALWIGPVALRLSVISHGRSGGRRLAAGVYVVDSPPC